MNNARVDMIERFRFLGTEELLHTYRFDNLSDLALEVALEELRRRGVAVGGEAGTHNRKGMKTTAGQDFMTVAKYFLPVEAHIVQGCLVAAGVPAVVADAHLIQTDSLLTPALGGVRILVPGEYLQQARDVIEAFNRGEFQLEDDADVSPPWAL